MIARKKSHKTSSLVNGQYPIDIAIAEQDKEAVVKLYRESAANLRIEFNSNESYPLQLAWREYRKIFDILYIEIIKNGDLKALNALLNIEGFEYDYITSEYWYGVQAAVACGQLDVLRYFIEVQHARSDVISNRGNDLVMLAVGYGHLHILKYLVEDQGFSLNTKNNFKDGPINFAAQLGRLEIFKYLINEKKLPYDKPNKTTSPLFKAIQYGHLNIVKYLIEKKTCSSYIVGGFEYSDLEFLAILYDHVDILKYLLKTGTKLEKEYYHKRYTVTPAVLAGWNTPNSNVLEWMLLHCDHKYLGTYQSLINYIKTFVPEKFKRVFSSVFDLALLEGKLLDFLNLTLVSFPIMDKASLKAFLEGKLDAFDKKGKNSSFQQTLTAYYNVFPVAALTYEANKLIASKDYDRVFYLCDKFTTSTNKKLRQKAHVIKAKLLYKLREEDSMPAAIQAFYLLDEFEGRKACSLKHKLNIILSPQQMAESDVSKDTWTEEAKRFYLLYAAIKPHHTDKQVLHLLREQSRSSDRIPLTDYTSTRFFQLKKETKDLEPAIFKRSLSN